jgi:hypothetical protein
MPYLHAGVHFSIQAPLHAVFGFACLREAPPRRAKAGHKGVACLARPLPEKRAPTVYGGQASNYYSRFGFIGILIIVNNQKLALLH